jgi:hypothetical protein
MKHLTLKIGLALALLCALAVNANAAISNTSGTTTLTDVGLGDLRVITLDWLSDASGNAVATNIPVTGRISQIVFYPDQADATSPTANYDVTLLDQLGVDAMQTLGANRSQADTEIIIPRVSFDFTDSASRAEQVVQVASTLTKAQQVVTDIGATSSSVNAATGITTNTLTYPAVVTTDARTFTYPAVVTTTTRAVDEPVFVYGTVTLAVSNAGNAKGGIVRVYVVKP